MALKDKLEKIADGIKDTAVDFTTLDVVTLNGKIDAVLEGSGANFKVKSLVKVLEDAKTNADVNVVAFTHIDFDQDTVQFVKKGLGPEEKELWTMHKDSIESAKNSRIAMLNFIKEVITGR